jgi:hypothetical protein
MCAFKAANSTDTLRLAAGFYTGTNNVGLSQQNTNNATDGGRISATGLKIVGAGAGATVVSCAETSEVNDDDDDLWLRITNGFVKEVCVFVASLVMFGVFYCLCYVV